MFLKVLLYPSFTFHPFINVTLSVSLLSNTLRLWHHFALVIWFRISSKTTISNHTTMENVSYIPTYLTLINISFWNILLHQLTYSNSLQLNPVVASLCKIDLYNSKELWIISHFEKRRVTISAFLLLLFNSWH